MIWQGYKEDRLKYTEELNNNKKNIKLTMKCSQKTVDFLDVVIFKDANGMLQTDMFRKETSVNKKMESLWDSSCGLAKSVPKMTFSLNGLKI